MRATKAFDCSKIKVDESTRALFSATAAEANDPRPEAMLKAVRDRGGKSLFLKFLGIARRAAVARRDPRRDLHDHRLGPA